MSTELKTLNGYSFDATKLGGLDAKYYAQGRAAHNLLDNSDFQINQRGQSSYAASGYTVDRWKIGDGTIEVHSSYLSIIATESNECVLKQIIDDLPDGTYTFAAKVNGVIKTRALTISGGTSTTIDNSNAGYTGGFLTLERATSVGKYFVTIRANAGYTVTTEWSALYEGYYTADTLPAYVPKGYAAELAECQRYYYQSWTGSIGANGIITRQSMATSRLASVDLPTTMRTTPTITLYNSSGTAGAVKDWNTSAVVSGMTVVYANTNSFVPANESSGLTAGNWYGFHYAASADL